MNTSGYTPEDLKLLHRVLDAALSEASGQELGIPLHTMTKRLFDAASTGERDPEKLKEAILDTGGLDDGQQLLPRS